jgi:NTE family protein
MTRSRSSLADGVPQLAPATDDGHSPLGVVLSGGGARAAYQVGILRRLARELPDLRFDIVTGVSAGAINAVHLAAHRGDFAEATEDLVRLWSRLTPDHIFRVGSGSLLRNVASWGLRLVSGGARIMPKVRGLVNTAPLDELLRSALRVNEAGEITTIAENLEDDKLRAVALTTLDYATGRTITWVQGCDIQNWERPHRRSATTRLTVDHVMASASLPLFFPAVRVGGHWHGDGGIRLSAPLSPALHLGARRILVVSTRYGRTQEEADVPATEGYPPPAQILGHLLNAVFLDVIDQDIARLERLNRLLEAVPPERRNGLHPVEMKVIRPSRDLGMLAADHEVTLPRAFRFLTRSLGTRETRSPDFLSIVMFQPEYLKELIEIGERDGEKHLDELVELCRCDPETGTA